jgi:hypothetical protein
MEIETSVSTNSEERLWHLNAEIVAAVAQRDHGRLTDLLAIHRALLTSLASGMTAFAKAEARASIQQAILIATSERAHLQQLLNECQARAAVIAAYSPSQIASPVGDVCA